MSVPSLAPCAASRALSLSARAVRRIAPLGLSLGFTAALLGGCGGGGGDDPAPTPSPTHQTLGVSVTGLAAGQSMVLQNNGTEDFTVSANGVVRTAASWPLGSSYAVTVKTQPTGQRCTVALGTGTLAVNTPLVQVECVQLPSDRNTLGGTIGGVPAGYTVVLTTGGEDLPITADGGFTFATPLAAGAAYAVTVKSKPDGLSCVVRNDTGTIAAAPVDTVAVRCVGQGALSNVFWEQDRCNPGPNGTGQKNGLRITPGRPVLLTVDAFVVNYSNAQCSGVGAPTAQPLVGAYTVASSRQEFGSEISAEWAARLTSPTMPMVFVRKGYYLCLLDDSASPSVYPNAASTANAVSAAIAAGTCYMPR